MPVSCAVKFTRLRTSSPAPMRSVKDSANWLTTRPRWTCLRESPTTPRAVPAAAEAPPNPWSPGSDGAHANNTATAMATPIVKINTGRSIPISPVRTVNRAAYCTSRSRLSTAKMRPSAAPVSESTRFSVRSCRRSRPRPAPRAARTANSRSRRTIRVSVRLATFAQASRRTRPTVPMSTRKVERASLVSSSCQSADAIWKPARSG